MHIYHVCVSINWAPIIQCVLIFSAIKIHIKLQFPHWNVNNRFPFAPQAQSYYNLWQLTDGVFRRGEFPDIFTVNKSLPLWLRNTFLAARPKEVWTVVIYGLWWASPALLTWVLLWVWDQKWCCVVNPDPESTSDSVLSHHTHTHARCL